MDIAQVKARIARTQERICQELCDLSDDLGDGFEVDVEISWLSVGTYDEPHQAVPCVEVSARVRLEG